MIKRLKQKIIYWLSRNLLPIVNDEELMIFKNGKPFINNKELTQGEIANLRAEADILEKTRLWGIIVNDLNEKSRKKIYIEAKDINDLTVGKTILFTLDIQKEFIKKIKTLKN